MRDAQGEVGDLYPRVCLLFAVSCPFADLIFSWWSAPDPAPLTALPSGPSPDSNPPSLVPPSGAPSAPPSPAPSDTTDLEVREARQAAWEAEMGRRRAERLAEMQADHERQLAEAAAILGELGPGAREGSVDLDDSEGPRRQASVGRAGRPLYRPPSRGGSFSEAPRPLAPPLGGSFEVDLSSIDGRAGADDSTAVLEAVRAAPPPAAAPAPPPATGARLQRIIAGALADSSEDDDAPGPGQALATSVNRSVALDTSAGPGGLMFGGSLFLGRGARGTPGQGQAKGGSAAQSMGRPAPGLIGGGAGRAPMGGSRSAGGAAAGAGSDSGVHARSQARAQGTGQHAVQAGSGFDDDDFDF